MGGGSSRVTREVRDGEVVFVMRPSETVTNGAIGATRATNQGNFGQVQNKPIEFVYSRDNFPLRSSIYTKDQVLRMSKIDDVLYHGTKSRIPPPAPALKPTEENPVVIFDYFKNAIKEATVADTPAAQGLYPRVYPAHILITKASFYSVGEIFKFKSLLLFPTYQGKQQAMIITGLSRMLRIEIENTNWWQVQMLPKWRSPTGSGSDGQSVLSFLNSVPENVAAEAMMNVELPVLTILGNRHVIMYFKQLGFDGAMWIENYDLHAPERSITRYAVFDASQILYLPEPAPADANRPNPYRP